MKKNLKLTIIILLLGVVLYLGGKLIFLGNQTEREEILFATSLKLNEEGYVKNDIQDIYVKYNPLKGGNLPYDVYVIFKENNSEAIIYSWTSVEKIESQRMGKTTP